MKPFVKICGLRSGDDVEAVAAMKPDALGFVFWRKSRRCVTPSNVAEWTRGVPASILRAGVFVDASLAEVARAIKQAKLDIVQLHGHEPPELCDLLPVKVWKMFSLDWKREEMDGYHVDAFLIDRYSDQSPGGTGETVDWGRAREFVKSTDTPVVLAGGLTPDNVREAIRKVRPWGVDVSSGVEERPGKKDLEKVRAFIQQCRKRS